MMARQSLKNICKLIEATQIELTVEDSFIRDLKRSIELADQRDARKPSETYKPSSMQCMRNMYYQRIGTPTDDDSSNSTLIGICAFGSSIHEWIQNAISTMHEFGMDCEYIDVAEFIKQRNLQNIEVKGQQGNETKLFDTNLNMSFMCDGIIRYLNHYYIVEFKSESTYKWGMRKEVDPKHYNQAIAYSQALGLPEVMFVYINRDTSDMKPYMFNVTDEMRKKLVEKIETCEEFVQNKTVPPKPEDVLKSTCQYCSYKNRCRRDG